MLCVLAHHQGFPFNTSQLKPFDCENAIKRRQHETSKNHPLYISAAHTEEDIMKVLEVSEHILKQMRI
jgi:hypothetical protein